MEGTDRTNMLPRSATVVVAVVLWLLFIFAVTINQDSIESVTWVLTTGATLFALIGGGVLFYFTRKLENSEKRLYAIIEGAADGVLTTDEYGYIESINTSVVAMFGYRPGELLSSCVTVLFSSAYRESRDRIRLTDFFKENGIDINGRPRELTGLKRDGSPFPMEVHASTTRLGERQINILMLRDVTERAEARETLKKINEALEIRVQERTTDLQQANKQLQHEIVQRKQTQAEREKLIMELQAAIAEIKTLSGFLPICAACKKIRDDQGYWNQIEVYIRDRSDAEFSHSICPDCMTDLYPELDAET